MNIFGFSKGSTPHINYITFQSIIKRDNHALLINTFPLNEQHVLIKGTMTPEEETKRIEVLHESYQYGVRIIIYGKNCTDETVDKKYHQLVNLGFTDVQLYRGGMFEWALLQDIYGSDVFQTTSMIKDPLVWGISGVAMFPSITNGSSSNNESSNSITNWGGLLTFLP